MEKALSFFENNRLSIEVFLMITVVISFGLDFLLIGIMAIKGIGNSLFLLAGPIVGVIVAIGIFMKIRTKVVCSK